MMGTRKKRGPAAAAEAAAWAGLLAAALLASSGCEGARAEGGSEGGRAEQPKQGLFSHAQHFGVITDLKCDDCHRPVSGGQFYLVDETKACEKCHDPKKSPEYAADVKKFMQPRVVGPFHHDRHAQNATARGFAALECTACHAGVKASTATSDPNVPAMSDCFKCHTKVETLAGRKGTECALCHVAGDFRGEQWKGLSEVVAKGTPVGEMDPKLIPETHKRLMGDYLKKGYDPENRPPDHTPLFIADMHGRLANAPGAACYGCHVDATCEQCHLRERPRSHTPRFIRATHGDLASMNRNACATCHQANFCISCHEQAPRNHTNAFRQGNHALQAQVELRSCFQCHRFEQDCVRCHNRR